MCVCPRLNTEHDAACSVAELHDAAALASFLANAGLAHLQPLLGGRHTLGSLFLRSEDRPVFLSHLREIGVEKLADRQRCANAVSRLRRTLPLQRAVPAARNQTIVLDEALRAHGSYGGAIGLLFTADGACQHVNEGPTWDVYGSCNLSPVAGYVRVDGPIVAEVARLAPLVGRPVFVPRCDEDPFVLSPSLVYQCEGVATDERKLADVRAALGKDVLVLTTAAVRGAPSDPCVALIPAFDRWASEEDGWLLKLRGAPLRHDLPYARRRDRAVWRGARTGGQPAVSLRGRVVAACRSKEWADVAFVTDMHSHGRGETVGYDGELSREAQAENKILLVVDGQAWASAWEWALASGSVIVYLGVWSLHLMAVLEPWVHYVPCESVDMLEARVQWVLTHPMEAERITQSAHSLFKRVATPEHTNKCVHAALARCYEACQ